MPTSRNEVIVKLKDELDAGLILIAHARESLTNEMQSEWAQKKLAVDKAFVSKLKELTAAFSSLTDAKIRLDKAEKAMERDLTAEEERAAVKGYLMDMEPGELRSFIAQVKRERDGDD